METNDRPRARDLGIRPGVLPAGHRNAITDVPGVRVGHRTLVRGGSVRTGVTAIVPHEGNLFREKVPAGAFVANGFGKTAGLVQLRELGTLETPIVLTTTLAVGTAIDAVVGWTLDRPGNDDVTSVNAVVGECNDARLNDVRSRPVRAADVMAAIDAAGASPEGAPVVEGCVGAGTGTVCFGFKGGIGTASRTLPKELGGFTLGVLVQTNFGGILTIDGRRVGEALGRYSFREHVETTDRAPGAGDRDGAPDPDAGSGMMILATDAPLDARQLTRLAARAPLGLARTGSYISHGSGDVSIAFSTAHRVPDRPPEGRTIAWEILHETRVSPLFLAAVEATEEAVLNSLVRATTTTARGTTIEALSLDVLRQSHPPGPSRRSARH